MELPPRICPECGEEYLPTTLICADCGVELGSEGPRRSADPGELPPSAELEVLRVAEPTWIEGLAEALAAQGIPSRVELLQAGDDPADQTRGRIAPRCTLYVRPEHREVAVGVDAAFARTQVPDLPEGGTSAWREAETCPACESELPAGASECPECGLAFVSED